MPRSGTRRFIHSARIKIKVKVVLSKPCSEVFPVSLHFVDFLRFSKTSRDHVLPENLCFCFVIVPHSVSLSTGLLSKLKFGKEKNCDKYCFFNKMCQYLGEMDFYINKLLYCYFSNK
ncbi:hypothetical protein GWI33_001704 [Rhynchophorus ferrugineus]|uniref:Uncharacterized protein n=1 Tax=Rhynchophorus ferrugineus TaxID=354439 RepID=A0A834IVQ9_RHYFE|nr:hypothetical protein GWI33_001704 [Rhynchophorus ferrugineus]